jgi:hypothetical protein
VHVLGSTTNEGLVNFHDASKLDDASGLHRVTDSVKHEPCRPLSHLQGAAVTEKSHGTNKAENFFSQLKRSLYGTRHSVSREHLYRYLNEFDYRYSTCELTDTERMADLATRVAGRLTYKAVTR